MSIPISLGISASRAQSDLSGGPFDVQSDIVFSGGYAGNSPYQGYSPDVTQTPTAEATGTGSILPSGSVPVGMTTAGGITSSGFFIPALLIAAVAGYFIWKHRH